MLTRRSFNLSALAASASLVLPKIGLANPSRIHSFEIDWGDIDYAELTNENKRVYRYVTFPIESRVDVVYKDDVRFTYSFLGHNVFSNIHVEQARRAGVQWTPQPLYSERIIRNAFEQFTGFDKIPDKVYYNKKNYFSLYQISFRDWNDWKQSF